MIVEVTLLRIRRIGPGQDLHFFDFALSPRSLKLFAQMAFGFRSQLREQPGNDLVFAANASALMQAIEAFVRETPA